MGVLSPPRELDLAGFTNSLLWQERTHEDPARRWIRDVIVAEATRRVDLQELACIVHLSVVTDDLPGSVTGRVSFNVAEGGKFVLSVELHGKVEGMSRDEAQALMQAAHEVCRTPMQLAATSR